jgi:diadenosine tetraphosphate (Ap4A) HIT family hydrolase
MKDVNCTLCFPADEDVLFACHNYRVIAVGGDEGIQYRGFCRVVWNDHVREMTDLNRASRDILMQAVYVVESALKASLHPDKINLASLGNMTPHLHWHVIPRYKHDVSFPNAIWTATNRTPVATLDDNNAWKEAVRASMIEATKDT